MPIKQPSDLCTTPIGSSNSISKTIFYSYIMKKVYSTLVSLFISVIVFGQCEDLTGNKDNISNWRSLYSDYFHLDSNVVTIKADSVLIYYFSNSKNETNYGMPCCYYLAEKYAQRELKDRLAFLYQKLVKTDVSNFKIAQENWQKYYESEWKFISEAFVGYSNVSTYGQGREIMIHNQAQHYQMIKDRIIAVEHYIELVMMGE